MNSLNKAKSSLGQEVKALSPSGGTLPLEGNDFTSSVLLKLQETIQSLPAYLICRSFKLPVLTRDRDEMVTVEHFKLKPGQRYSFSWTDNLLIFTF